jgi:hypothetical protein
MDDWVDWLNLIDLASNGDRESPVLNSISSLVSGMIIGWLSLLFFPDAIIKQAIPVPLFLIPFASAIVVKIIPKSNFYYTFIFVFGMCLIRFKVFST